MGVVRKDPFISSMYYHYTYLTIVIFVRFEIIIFLFNLIPCKRPLITYSSFYTFYIYVGTFTSPFTFRFFALYRIDIKSIVNLLLLSIIKILGE